MCVSGVGENGNTSSADEGRREGGTVDAAYIEWARSGGTLDEALRVTDEATLGAAIGDVYFIGNVSAKLNTN